MVHSSVNFQVPLIIIVPHREAPPLPLLPLPMTVTSYHGNQINLQDHGLSLHIAPVWTARSTGHWATLHKMFPAHTFFFCCCCCWDLRRLLPSLIAAFFGQSKPKNKKIKEILKKISRIHHRHWKTLHTHDETCGSLQWFWKRKWQRKKEKDKNIQNLFSLRAVSHFYPIVDQYSTFLYLMALSRDNVQSLKCSSSHFSFFS